MLRYKGYTGHVEFDDEAGIFHGEISGIKDVVTFQGKSVTELQKAFQDSIDDYLDFCASRGESPEKPFSGKLALEINPELHHKLFLKASNSGKSLNEWVIETLEATP